MCDISLLTLPREILRRILDSYYIWSLMCRVCKNMIDIVGHFHKYCDIVYYEYHAGEYNDLERNEFVHKMKKIITCDSLDRYALQDLCMRKDDVKLLKMFHGHSGYDNWSLSIYKDAVCICTFVKARSTDETIIKIYGVHTYLLCADHTMTYVLRYVHDIIPEFAQNIYIFKELTDDIY